MKMKARIPVKEFKVGLLKNRLLPIHSLIAWVVTGMSLILGQSQTNGQVVSMVYGSTYIAHKSRVKLHPEVRGKGLGGNDDSYLQIEYLQRLQKNCLLTVSYSRYPLSTMFSFQNEEGGGSYGWPQASMVDRIGIGGTFQVLSKTKFILQPGIELGFHISKPKGFGIVGIIPTDLLPDGFEQTGPVTAMAYKQFQVVPVLGIKLGYAFWNRLELFLDVRQVWGFKTLQEIRLEYSYKGVQQPTAINYSDGTGRFWGLGIGYRIVKARGGKG